MLENFWTENAPLVKVLHPLQTNGLNTRALPTAGQDECKNHGRPKQDGYNKKDDPCH